MKEKRLIAGYLQVNVVWRRWTNPAWQAIPVLFSCPRLMTKLRPLILVFLVWAPLAVAQISPPPDPYLHFTSDQNEMEINYDKGYHSGILTNNVRIQYITPVAASNAVMVADWVSFDEKSGEIRAAGNVHFWRHEQTFISDQMLYNFRTGEVNTNVYYNYKSGQFDSGPFRTGQAPLFAEGRTLHSVSTNTMSPSNRVYTATSAYVTADDYAKPFLKIRAHELTLVPGKYVEARDALVYVSGLPVFYFPYYHHDISQNQNSFIFVPGYRSLFGPYLLSGYNWYLNEELNGSIHADWREKRGFGGGPDFNYNLGRWGQGTIRGYYTHDNEPGLDPINNAPLPSQRERGFATYDAMPFTNLTVKGQGSYQSDPYIIRDFFESQYQRDVQPNTFFDVNRYWRNWSLDAMAQPRVNAFNETVERLPEVRLTGYRQQIFHTPFYYESESTVGYYRRLFSDTNLLSGGNYMASRADTFQQITMPETLFGWLNFTPRAGGRFTYYSEATGPGGTNSELYRGVFNTGAEVSFKASRLWSTAQNHFFEIDGLRHIFEPSINYVFIPRPNVLPAQIPQFDYELTNSLHMLPIEFPDYNAIDSINSQNTIRFGMDNRLQTKRKGEIDDMLDWSVYMDWYLRPRSDQGTFSDIFSDLTFKPKSWLIFGSQTRYDISRNEFNLAQHRLTFQPNDTWSWTVGHFYLRDGPLFGLGDNLITSTFFYKLNENWGAKVAHYFDARTGTLQEQDYSIYRDLRSWTAAVTFRALNNLVNGHDYTVALTFSFKALPRFGLGQDSVSKASLIGY